MSVNSAERVPPVDPQTVAPVRVRARPGRGHRQQARRWRHKGLVAVHVTSAVGLLGVDLAVLVLGVAGWRGADPRTVYPAAHLLGTWLLLPLAVTALLTGITLGMITRWGVVRYWWVAIKLLVNNAGLVLAALVLLPALQTAARAAAVSPVLPISREGLLKDTVAAVLVLTATVLLSVFKPFGPVRRRGNGPRATHQANHNPWE